MYSTAESAHGSARLRSAAFSASSMVRAQRSLVAVQSTRYVHVADSAGGIHWAGSRSALDRLVFAVTATRDLSEPRSLA